MSYAITKIIGYLISAWLLGLGLGYAFRMIHNIYDALFKVND